MQIPKFRQSQTFNWYTISWLIALIVTVILFYHVKIGMKYIGIVEKKAHTLGPQEPGTIQTLFVQVGDSVKKNQVLAVLDMSDLKISLGYLQQEFSLIRRLNQSQKDYNVIALERLRMQAENEFADLIGRVSLIESQIAELNGLNREIERLENAEQAGLGYNRDLPDLVIRRDALESYLSEQRSELSQLTRKLDRIRKSRKKFEQADVDSITGSLLLEQLEYPEAIRREIVFMEHRMQMRTIYSPCDGVITDILAYPGDVVQDFDSLIVVEEIRPRYLTVYLPEKARLIPEAGMEARIFSPRKRAFNTTGTVTFVHPGLVQTNGRLSFRGQIFWARKVRMELAGDHELLPGELVKVRISGHRKKHRQVASLHAAEGKDMRDKVIQRGDSDLKEMHVPDMLRKASRFEPSGIVWIPEMDRYLIVSDDTGIKDRKSDHAPWLFTMKDGAVDAAPVTLSGIDKVNDLESVAYAGHDLYYFCSSQNISRQGKRPGTREYLIKVKRTGSGFQVLDKIELLSLIESGCSPEEQARLGLLQKEEDGRPVLNIEGMAWYDNALYFGLKEPLLDGDAIILKLSDAASLFDSHRLSSNQLTRFGTVNLGSFKGRQAAFSDIYMDPEGRLWALSTVADVEKTDQMGTLHRVHHYPDGHLEAEPLVRFPEMKPEGICLNPGGQFLIVVDCDSQTPLYCSVGVGAL
ncbi:HlyD family efflux transporter periplasmic adaptor subunit [bacterium]|nr:HlyD family efflux transporter periplasmic adaptor subunit [bacterium]